MTVNAAASPDRTPMTTSNTTTLTRPTYAPRTGFTLIEILVVIALTLVLLVLVFAPLIQAFQFTGRAQSTAAAQDAARNTTELMTRELTSAAGVLDTSDHYLNLRIRAKSGDQVVARAYNAYIDIVPPRPRPGSVVDPTVDPNNPTVNLSTSGNQTLPELTLPLAPGTDVVRYFIGPRYPYTTATPNVPTPYVNRYEGLTVPSGGAASTLSNSSVATAALNNPYVMYRASYQPYTITTTGGTTSSSGNTNLFALTAPATQGGQPIVNDPDFFRIVVAGETDPSTGNPYKTTASAPYTTATTPDPNDDPDYVTAHNARVLNWIKIAKFVIADQNIDLLAIKRTVGGNLVYSAATNVPVITSYPSGSAATVALVSEQLPTDGTTTDTVYLGATATADTTIPTIRTTVNFGPGLVANDPLAPTNAADVSQGSAALAVSNYAATLPYVTASLPYIPALYKGAYGWWQGNPTFTINRANQPGNTAILNKAPFTTIGSGAGSTQLVTPNFSGSATPGASDLILYDSTGAPVYDITLSTPFLNAGNTTPAADYVALTFDARRGTANFAIPALPNPQYYGSGGTTNPLYTNPYWTQVETGATATGAPTGTTPLVISGTNTTLDLGTLANSVTFGGSTVVLQAPFKSATNQIDNPYAAPNARMVFNSERVMGPDMSAGIMGAPSSTLPAVTSWVPYTRVASSTSLLGPNQYYVDYNAGTIQFSSSAPPTLPSTGTPTNNIEIAFSYQNNLDTTNAPYTAATVQASYLTAATIQLNFGIRAYDSATSVSSYFALNSKVAVSNAKA